MLCFFSFIKLGNHEARQDMNMYNSKSIHNHMQQTMTFDNIHDICVYIHIHIYIYIYIIYIIRPRGDRKFGDVLFGLLGRRFR